MPRSTDQPVAGSEFPPLSLCEDLGREAGKGNIQFRLWFDDGGVVLIAEHTAFRVHASFLSRHSPVFKELFTVPPAPNGERIGGCRVFHTSDSAEDLNYLLQLTYDAPCLLRPINPSGDTAKPSFAMISALMRLGHKYEFFTLVDDAARYLETYYTTNSDVWEQLRDGKQDAPFTFSDNPAADAIDAVDIARLTGRYAMLPVASLSTNAASSIPSTSWKV
ncbi:hypothetical protein BD311DRAFT_866075 [Dichomitus squalens]|uniref:BTB domain-containing protein n=1 Tax=Dichomitus squalens TaxID=114155 RepID=A0A4Q9MJ40_9APHY|nr:hypothetical protein BD311DRAFT_866075 [Dichomitus squalens]